MEISNNELIAEFMGLEFFLGEVRIIPIKSSQRPYWIKPNYDTSWDWLIPVVYQFKKKHETIDIPYVLYMNVIGFTVDRPIGELYENLIKAIKWYNTQIIK